MARVWYCDKSASLLAAAEATYELGADKLLTVEFCAGFELPGPLRSADLLAAHWFMGYLRRTDCLAVLQELRRGVPPDSQRYFVTTEALTEATFGASSGSDGGEVESEDFWTHPQWLKTAEEYENLLREAGWQLIQTLTHPAVDVEMGGVSLPEMRTFLCRYRGEASEEPLFEGGDGEEDLDYATPPEKGTKTQQVSRPGKPSKSGSATETVTLVTTQQQTVTGSGTSLETFVQSLQPIKEEDQEQLERAILEASQSTLEPSQNLTHRQRMERLQQNCKRSSQPRFQQYAGGGGGTTNSWSTSKTSWLPSQPQIKAPVPVAQEPEGLSANDHSRMMARVRLEESTASIFGVQTWLWHQWDRAPQQREGGFAAWATTAPGAVRRTAFDAWMQHPGNPYRKPQYWDGPGDPTAVLKGGQPQEPVLQQPQTDQRSAELQRLHEELATRSRL